MENRESKWHDYLAKLLMFKCFVQLLSKMVTGYGVNGGRGRCYTLWKDFITCAKKHGTYGPEVCQAEREDYIECLHHAKLVSIIVVV